MLAWGCPRLACFLQEAAAAAGFHAWERGRTGGLMVMGVKPAATLVWEECADREKTKQSYPSDHGNEARSKWLCSSPHGTFGPPN